MLLALDPEKLGAIEAGGGFRMEYGNAANPFNQRFILSAVQAKVDDFHATSLEARNVFLHAHAN